VVERLAHGHDRHGQRWHLHLPREEESLAQVRPLILLLGLPTFGLSLAISVLTTYGPVVLLRLTHSPTAVGALIGVEGALALVIPLAAGEISDRLPPSPLGRRLPFVLVGASAPRRHGARAASVQLRDGYRRSLGLDLLRRLLHLLPALPRALRRSLAACAVRARKRARRSPAAARAAFSVWRSGRIAF
jgi:hypothetical protein